LTGGRHAIKSDPLGRIEEYADPIFRSRFAFYQEQTGGDELRKKGTLFSLFLASTWLLVSCQRQPVVFKTSDSPDGRYQCVVTEQSPRWPQGSPFVYTFTIKEKATNKELPGKPGTYNSDSAQIGVLEFKWESNRLSITNLGYSPPYMFETAEMDNGVQRWNSQERKALQEYGYVFQETTGTNQYILINGQRNPMTFSETSNETAVKSLQSLKPGIVYENSKGDQIFVSGEYDDRSRTFRLSRWYIKIPFEESVIENETAVPHRVHKVVRHSLERADFDSRNGFDPNDPSFDPKSFQKPR
jgi:hypothetical protein